MKPPEALFHRMHQLVSRPTELAFFKAAYRRPHFGPGTERATKSATSAATERAAPEGYSQR
eukprot:3175727-Alexandrium_andersonii.AAC.1